MASSRSWSNRSEEHTSELQSQSNIVCRLLLEKKKKDNRLRPGRTVAASFVRAPRGLPAAHAPGAVLLSLWVAVLVGYLLHDVAPPWRAAPQRRRPAESAVTGTRASPSPAPPERPADTPASHLPPARPPALPPERSDRLGEVFGRYPAPAFFFLMPGPPPALPLFPHTTLLR